MSKDVRVPPGRVLVVGLGNPGDKYHRTRHNIGWEVLDRLADRCGIVLNDKRFKGVLGTGRLLDRDVVLLKPQTFMNLSGESVGPAAGFWKLTPGSIIVLHDEIEIPPGQVRLKVGGGHAGHNGLRSMDQHLPSKEYFRVRLGVGRPLVGEVSNWVLGRFVAEESSTVDRLCEVGIDAVERIIRDGLVDAQNVIHALK
jgi:peptidyl-tRNA hydrolase, PTH1 family